MNPEDPVTPRSMPPQASLDDAAFAASLQALLHRNENDLDFVTASRLSAARARAVEQAGASRLVWPWAAAVPTAFAAVLMAWIVLPAILSPGSAHRAATPAAPIEVLELLGADEAPVADEELDFAQWLDQQSTTPPAEAGRT